MRLEPSITTAVVFFVFAVLLVVVAFPFVNMVAKMSLAVANYSVIYTNGTVNVQVANQTITMNEPKYYTSQYNLVLTLYSFFASPFYDIILFAMLVGVGFVYWFLRSR